MMTRGFAVDGPDFDPGPLNFEDIVSSASDIRSDAADLASLRATIDERVVPQLLAIHRQWRGKPQQRLPDAHDIEQFTRLAINADPSAARRAFERFRASGLSADVLFEALLAPTARRLGEMWCDDECDFVDVTFGVNRLQTLLEMFRACPVGSADAQRSALLVATPNDPHLFGLDLVAAFLRAAGWDVEIQKGADAEDNAAAAASRWFVLVGVTMGREEHLEAVARAIQCVRAASLNPGLAVIVGGRVFSGRPDLVAQVGADASAEDGPGAALLAQKLYLSQTDMASRAKG